MADFDIGAIVRDLNEARRQWRQAHRPAGEVRGIEFPSRDALATILGQLKGVLFPLRLGPPDLRQESEDFHVAHALDTALHALLRQVRIELRYSAALRHLTHTDIEPQALEATRAFGAALPGIRTLLDSDVIAAFQGDPAARSVDEVLLCYPGIHAMIHYRLAHCLYGLGLPLLARIIAEQAHAETGIDIHPGATIGAGFFIDHGTGVVIGETAVIGQRVRLYQAVTLGAKRFPANVDGSLQKGLPRHPVVEDDVVIYAGATVLGRITIGKGAVIGGNVWLTHDVPAGARVAQAASREDDLGASDISGESA
ncbi:serine acetyltransferase [Massilia sp. Root133]|jgi:serine O-acetyltransferase|uniref:serine O-acetyltransferase EpsC n=1 Tax=unclassified Massilia TaxID=2609279 RepID=UPI0006FAC0E3|nr:MULTISPECIES: serine O-acetyltransferase EpsC [unclassified Massilia]KQY17006.1 serine acetyltransferase [Massilia sp. Root133]KQZ46225.1 serine acetyltransferase [Massilia sp. Root1485]